VQLEIQGEQRKTLVVSDDVIRIEKKGLFGGKKREKTIPIRNITSVEVKKPGIVTAGFIQLSIAGGHARDSSFSLTGGALAARTDENSVTFLGKDRYAEALEVKSYVEEWSTRHEQQLVTSAPASVAPVSVADEILKLKALADEGILTAEEFEVQKKELLGPKASAESQTLDHHRQGDEKVNPSVEISQENEDQGEAKAQNSLWKWLSPTNVSLLFLVAAVLYAILIIVPRWGIYTYAQSEPVVEGFYEFVPRPKTLSAAEHLKFLVMCEGVTVLVLGGRSIYWGQAPGQVYAGNPQTSGQFQLYDEIQFLMSEPNANGEVRVKVFPHDGRAVGKSDDQVWISWEEITRHRHDMHAFRCHS